MDYLIYGAVLPLMGSAPGGSVNEDRLGLLGAAYALGVLGATPLFGWLGQSRGCRTVMTLGVLLSGVATGLFLVAPDFPVLLAARLGQGIASAAVWIAGLALIAERYSGRRVEMMGYALMGSTGGAILGPLMGSWLFAIGGYSLPLLVLLVFTGCQSILCILLPLESRHSAGRQIDLFAVLMDQSVVVPAVAVALAAAAWGVLEPLLPLRLTLLGEDHTSAIGLLFAIATMVYGLAAPFVSWLTEKISVRWTIVIGMIGMALSLPALGTATGFWSFLIILCIVGIFFALLLNPTSAELGDAVERRGLTCYPAVYSVYNIAYALGMVGASTFAASVAVHVGFLMTLLFVSIVLLLCVPLIVVATRRTRVA